MLENYLIYHLGEVSEKSVVTKLPKTVVIKNIFDVSIENTE